MSVDLRRAAVPLVLLLALIGVGLWLLLARDAGPAITLLEPPGRALRASIADASATLVNGRRVTPAGTIIRTQSYSWGLAISPDQRRAALLRADAIELVDLLGVGAQHRLPARKPPLDRDLDLAVQRTGGLVQHQDGRVARRPVVL